MKKTMSIFDCFAQNAITSKQQLKVIGGTEPINPPAGEDKGKPSSGGILPTDGSSPPPPPTPN